MSKVFVGNFSFGVDEEKLKEFFGAVGEVIAVKIMRDIQTGRSRGFGFVEFSKDGDAEEAIERLNNANWDGRVIKVSEDRSTRKDGSAPGEGNASSGGSYDPSKKEVISFFKAQPPDAIIRRKKKLDYFFENKEAVIDYKDPATLARFVGERGKLNARRTTGLNSFNQRKVVEAIKRAQHLALMPYVRN